MFGLATLAAVTKAVVLVFGGAITLLARRAATRTGSSALRLFSVGFAAITIGTLLGGAVAGIPGIDVRAGDLLGNLVVAAGFAVLGYSLYAGGGGSPPADTA